MRTVKKSTKTNAKTSTSTSRSVAKAKPRATAKRAAAKPKKRAATRKTAPKAKAKPKAKAVAAKKTSAKKAPQRPDSAKKIPQRRDAVGRLDPRYARDLRALSREGQAKEDDRAFFSTPRTGDDLAEELGEEAVGTMTSGEDQSDRLIEGEVEEERGGPFVKTRGGDEFARGTNESNPRGATREPFPRT